MPTNFRPDAGQRLKLQIAAALLIVYVVWGTTYHALNIAMQGMPPLLMNGSRFLAAGVIMLMIARWQQQAWPTAAQWRHCALVGGLMTAGAMGLVMQAQAHGIGSGLMATVVTTMPMWLALWTRWGGERVPVTSWVGLLLGVAGAGVLALEGDFSASVLGGFFAFAAPLCWSLGSYASRKLDMPPVAMSSAAQWLVGGALSGVMALAFEPASRDWTPSQLTWAAGWAWIYLMAIGTLLTLNAYLWLLQNTPSALAGSYSFVNPVVALWVGVAWGGERLTGQVFLALPLILAALGLIIYGQALMRWLPAWARPRVSV